jgi:hypothetical protein
MCTAIKNFYRDVTHGLKEKVPALIVMKAAGHYERILTPQISGEALLEPAVNTPQTRRCRRHWTTGQNRFCDASNIMLL